MPCSPRLSCLPPRDTEPFPLFNCMAFICLTASLRLPYSLGDHQFLTHVVSLPLHLGRCLVRRCSGNVCSATSAARAESSAESRGHWQGWEPQTGLELRTLTAEGYGWETGLPARAQGRLESLVLRAE